jgi:hypothetical protein
MTARWRVVACLAVLVAVLVVLSVVVPVARSQEGELEAPEVARVEPSARGSRPAIEATIRERAEAHGVSPWLLVEMGDCESRLDPLAVGRQGEQGLMQLAPFGLLPLFYQRDYTDPWSVYQQADFTAWAISSGLAGHWSCYYIVTGQRPPWWR